MAVDGKNPYRGWVHPRCDGGFAAGSHEELLRRGGLYSQLCHRQLRLDG
jgi:hypothetical protein